MGSHRTTKVVVAVGLAALLLLGVIGAVLHHSDAPLHSATATAATGPSPSGRSHGRVPKGFKALDDASDGLVIDVPTSWRTPALTQGSYVDMLRTFAAENPDFASIVAPRVSNSAAPIGLFAVDPVSRSTLAIESAPLSDGGAADPTVLPSQLRDRYTELGIALVSTDNVQLPAGKALHASLRYITAGKEIVASQYFVVNGSKLVTLTVQGLSDGEPASAIDQIAHTLDRTS